MNYLRDASFGFDANATNRYRKVVCIFKKILVANAGLLPIAKE